MPPINRAVDIAATGASTEVTGNMSESAIQEHPGLVDGKAGHSAKARKHDRGLLLIGLFKLSKSAFFFAVGIGAIRLLHKDLGDVAMRVASALKLDVEGRFVSFLVEKVDLIDMRHLREAGLGAFAYSGLALLEGIGLTLEKTWAEYLTVGLTVSFLPWELYELVKRPDLVRLALLLANLAVLAYLLWLLRKKRMEAARLIVPGRGA
jgi:uncharacterized membrane protein (DUF2068 family)